MRGIINMANMPTKQKVTQVADEQSFITNDGQSSGNGAAKLSSNTQKSNSQDTSKSVSNEKFEIEEIESEPTETGSSIGMEITEAQEMENHKSMSSPTFPATFATDAADEDKESDEANDTESLFETRL